MDWIKALIIFAYAATCIVMLLLIAYSSICFIRNPVPTFLWLAITALAVFLAALFEILSVLSKSPSFSNLYIRLAYECFALMIVFLVFFSESYTHQSMRIMRVSIITFITGIYSYAFLNSSVMELKNEIYNLYDYSSSNWQLSILAVLTFALVTIWFSRCFIFAFKKARHKEDARRIILIIIGFFFAAIVTPTIKELWFQVFTKNAHIQAIMAGVIANLFLAIGVSLLIIPYLSARSLQFLLPQNYYYLIVVNDAGIMLWEHKYQEHQEMEGVLLSAALVAIRSLLQDATGFESPLKAIQFQDITFVVSFKEQIAGLLILDHSSQYIERQLKIFTSRFYENFQQAIGTNTWRYTPEIMEKTKQLMKSTMLID